MNPKKREIPHVYLTTKILWCQVDANQHLRHSAYADLASQARIEAMVSLGFDAQTFANLNIGPILFKEESIYKREINSSETVQVTCLLSSCKSDGSMWSFYQEVYREDGKLAASITVSGAWLDMKTRKLVPPPEAITTQFLTNMPRTKDCEIYDSGKR